MRDLDIEATTEFDDGWHSPVQVLTVEVNDTHAIGKGIDIDTGDTVEWTGSPMPMLRLLQVFNETDEDIYTLVPQWAERKRERYEAS